MQSSTTSVRTIMKPPAQKPEPKKPRKERPQLKQFKNAVTKPSLPWAIVAVAIVFSLFMFVQYRDAKTKLQPAAATKKQVTSLVGKVDKLAVIPKDETPLVITVSHAAQVNNQTFYRDAQDGDKVLVFNKAKKAILYRPSTDQIVNIAPVNVGANTTPVQ
ncbi:MAG: hypothetical protein JWO41_497 [Candidatus Saccharibacteria bacterium]|nr:hypothetical protein [Candidatus Saccharibacteria bacterium]